MPPSHQTGHQSSTIKDKVYLFLEAVKFNGVNKIFLASKIQNDILNLFALYVEHTHLTRKQYQLDMIYFVCSTNNQRRIKMISKETFLFGNCKLFKLYSDKFNFLFKSLRQIINLIQNRPMGIYNWLFK